MRPCTARLFAFFIVAFPALAAADQLVIAGGGFAGKWDTEIELTNPGATALDVTLSIDGPPLGLPCPPNCQSNSYTVPGNGTLRVRASDFIGPIFPGPQMVYVSPNASDAALPVVHARIVSDQAATQFAELPVARLSTLSSSATTSLVFPGAQRGNGAYSNLIVASVGPGATDGTAKVEVFDAAGTLRGSATILVTGPGTPIATTVVDVVGAIGAGPDLDLGSVRVTRTSGQGAFWGVLATVFDAGYIQVSVGANP
jgi:hypothetical protein